MFDFLSRREYRVIYQCRDHKYYSSTILLARTHAGAKKRFTEDERYANCKCVLTLVL